ncbi:MAG: AbrB family transcriptional regulator [Streptococcaceae bacterium]|jgi:antitoxin component of MazEF toxin-antitoxin module|nr:AbrB family transcriptional regulator [Streptococcaceae bacterium]
MLEMRTRKVGASVAITLPKELNIPVDKDFIVSKTADGSLIFVPKIKNPLDELPDDFVMADEFSEAVLTESEID